MNNYPLILQKNYHSRYEFRNIGTHSTRVSSFLHLSEGLLSYESQPPSLEVCNTKRSVPMGTPASRYNTPCQPHFVTLNAHFLFCKSKGSTFQLTVFLDRKTAVPILRQLIHPILFRFRSYCHNSS